jgi:hypothetical protein
MKPIYKQVSNEMGKDIYSGNYLVCYVQRIVVRCEADVGLLFAIGSRKKMDMRIRRGECGIALTG